MDEDIGMRVLRLIVGCLLPLVVTICVKTSAASEPVVFCYYSSHAQNRVGAGKFLPEDIDASLCTHVIYAFADVIQGKYLKASRANDLPQGSKTGLYGRTQALKSQNPQLKVLVAVGGWRIGSAPFLPLVKSQRSRRIFTRNAIRFLRRHGFDGLDVDWEFPGTRGSEEDDKYEFTKLLQTLQGGFEREARQTRNSKLLLTMAAAGGSYFINLAYEADKIAQYIDFILVMAYNYHGNWNKFTGHHSGMYPRSDETGGEREWNQAWTIDYWMNEARVPRDKLVIGISTYGMSFTLADPDQHGLMAPAAGAGAAGPYSQEEGVLSYTEICEKLREGWTSVWISEQQVPYAHHGDQWVGYDNVQSVKLKARNIKKKGLAGAFIWSVEMDDFSGRCGTGKYPLLSAIVGVLRGLPLSNDDISHYDADEYDNDYYDEYGLAFQDEQKPLNKTRSGFSIMYRKSPVSFANKTSRIKEKLASTTEKLKPQRPSAGVKGLHVTTVAKAPISRSRNRTGMVKRTSSGMSPAWMSEVQSGVISKDRGTGQKGSITIKGWQCQTVKMQLVTMTCRAYVICVPSDVTRNVTSCPPSMTYSAVINACSRLVTC